MEKIVEQLINQEPVETFAWRSQIKMLFQRSYCNPSRWFNCQKRPFIQKFAACRSKKHLFSLSGLVSWLPGVWLHRELSKHNVYHLQETSDTSCCCIHVIKQMFVYATVCSFISSIRNESRAEKFCFNLKRNWFHAFNCCLLANCRLLRCFYLISSVNIPEQNDLWSLSSCKESLLSTDPKFSRLRKHAHRLAFITTVKHENDRWAFCTCTLAQRLRLLSIHG